MSTTPSSADERALFETQMVEDGYNVPQRGPFPDSGYLYKEDQDRFIGWQAGRASLGAAQVPAEKYDDVLAPFVALMRRELHANSGKGDRPGWLAMSRQTAMLEIWHHAAKLQKAALNDDTAGIQEHAADVANMSMMLADVCGVLDVSSPAGAELAMRNVCCGRRVCGGECGKEWQGMEKPSLRPLDDPGLQQMFSDVIEGAIAFGFQGDSAPPEDHWLTRFWNINRAQAPAGATQVPSLPSAEQLGKDVAKWTGFEFTTFRGDTGAAEQRVTVSVERLGYAVEAVVKAALSQPSQQKPAEQFERSYTTQPGESIRGIALRQLGNESRWGEIYDRNCDRFPDVGQHDYYPVGTVLDMPVTAAKDTA